MPGYQKMGVHTGLIKEDLQKQYPVLEYIENSNREGSLTEERTFVDSLVKLVLSDHSLVLGEGSGRLKLIIT